MFNKTLLIVFVMALAMQLTGCFYRDDRWHHDHDRDYHPEHHDSEHHDSGIDVHLHG